MSTDEERQMLTAPEGVETSSYQRKEESYKSAADDEVSVSNCNERRHRWAWIISGVCVLFLTFMAGQHSKRRSGHSHRISHQAAPSAADTCPKEDAILNLKPSSTKEGMKNGAVAADHPICSEMGRHILQDKGGNAVDAAVTVALCLGVANPASSGLGGGGFLLVHADETDLVDDTKTSYIDAREPERMVKAESGKITEVIDCREIAPAAASTLMFDGLPKHASERGGLAVPIPGELRCLELAHERHGRLSWADVVQPAYELASIGPAINANLAHEIGIMKKRYTLPVNRKKDWGLREFLTHHNTWESAKVEGDILYNAPLARTLKTIRDKGADAFYKGKIAEGLARDIQNAGGIVTKEDIEGYRATLRTPVAAHDVLGFSIVGVPPPSSGGAAIIGAARFLSSYLSPFATFADTLSVHRLVEASKHAFAIRMSLSDPDYASEVNAAAVKDLVEGDYMAKLAMATPDDELLPMSQYGGARWAQLNDTDGAAQAVDAQEGDRRRRLSADPFGYLEDSGTSHFSIVDSDGNAVSMTTSVNTYFGSNVYSKSAGIILSDTMDDFGCPGRPNYFGLTPSKANFIVPGKKPLSSMAPTMVFRGSGAAKHDDRLGELVMVVGASGGPKIISAVLQVITRFLFQGLSLFDALVYPRVHDQLIYHGSAVTTTENASLEQGPGISVSNRTRESLSERGHRLLDISYGGSVQAISVDLETKELSASCDVRKGGTPAGF